MSAEDCAVRVEDLRKSFGPKTALDGVSLNMPRGRVFGLLGPNGAGKTTTVRILATLLRPDSGRVVVAGADVRTQPDRVRRSLGLSGQYAAVDDRLTGFENLHLVAKLYGMRRGRARATARAMLERFQLDHVAEQRAGTYSGGMRRRLDLAGALIAAPPVVVLDEPTTGLDPRSRLDTWDIVTDLVDGGTTVLLTTQYLEEADRLADRIAVIDHGRVIGEGTGDQLKRLTGGERLELVTAEERDLTDARRIVASVGAGPPSVDVRARRVEATVHDGQTALSTTLRLLDELDIRVLDLALRRATLDDVFLSLTSRPADSTDREPEEVGA